MWALLLLILLFGLLVGWWYHQSKCRFPYKVCDPDSDPVSCLQGTIPFKNDKGVGCLPSQTCPQRRQDICAKVYRPVCGFTATGIRQTYPNACEACSAGGITQWTPGPCEVYFSVPLGLSPQ